MISSLYDCFKHWSLNGSVFIMSDTHFADPDCPLMNPQWISPEEQLKIINKSVLPADTLVLLGDIGKPEFLSQIRAKKKVLITGNHDKPHIYFDQFSELYNGPLFISDKILLSHEPVLGLPFCINIHGHVHNGQYEWTDELGGRHINLAADVCSYAPINLGKEIKKGMLKDVDDIHRLTIENAKLHSLRP